MAENAPPGSASNTSNDNSTRGMPHYDKLRSNLRDTLAKKRALDAKVAQLDDLILTHETAYLEETSAAGNIIRGFDNYIKAATTTGTSTSASISGVPSGIIGGVGSSLSSSTALGSLSAGTSTRRRAQISDADRVFSKSSAAFTNADPNASSPPASSGGLVAGGGMGGGGGDVGGGEGSRVGTPRSGGQGATPREGSMGGSRDTPKSEVGKGAGGNRSKDKKKGGGGVAAAAVEKGGEKEEDEEGRPAKRGKITYGRD